MICGASGCGFLESHKIHAVDEEREALAAEVDSRRLGEGGETNVE